MEEMEKDMECGIPIKRRRGPRRVYDPVKVLDVLTQNKALLFDPESGTVTSAFDKIWKKMAEKLAKMGQCKSAESLYTYVACNQDGVRFKLDPTYQKPDVLFDDDSHTADQSVDPCLDTSESKTKNNVVEFTVAVPSAEFKALVESRPTFLTDTDTGKIITRNRKRCLSDEWQTYLTDLAWKHQRIKHGFSFDYHQITLDLSSAHSVGHCACRAVLDCYLTEKHNVTSLRFVISGGDPKEECGKRPLRGKRRAELAKRLENKTPHIIRMEMINELMGDDDPEPPQIPSSPVMRMLRHETIASKRLHKDPIKALQILKATKMKDEITTIRSEPVFVSYATAGQQKIHRRVAKDVNLSLKIDATSNITRSFRKIDGVQTGPLQLFHAVIRTPSGHQIALGQLLTESQTAGTVQEWLEDWLEGCKLPFPKEVVTDQGKGLLVGCVRALTGYETVNSYADALFDTVEGDRLPRCYMRIDVAHYTKIWVKHLQNVNKSVAKYYKGGMGKLMMSRNKADAETIIRCLLTISQSPTCGIMAGGEPSPCERAKGTMEKIFTTNIFDNSELSSDGQEEVQDAPTTSKTRKRNIQPSMWRDWGQQISAEVEERIQRNEGNLENELFLPEFAHKLLDELRWLPLWSSISRDLFQYGAVPASSAEVESCFNVIKTWLLNKMQTPRLDYFIALHKDYLDALSKSVRNKMDEYDVKQLETHNSVHKPSDPSSHHMQQDETTDSHVADDDEHFPVRSPLHQSSPLSSNPGCLLSEKCQICAAGDLPTGSHQCQDCGCAVHIFPPCSYSIGDDEGYGERRQCAACHGKTEQEPTESIQRNKPQDPLEDANLSEKKKFSYLKKTYPPGFFTPKKSLNIIPVLKSGDDSSLKAIRSDGIRISLSNTQLFDALFHLVLTIATDVAHFSEYVERNIPQNTFFEMIKYVHKSQRIAPNAYVKRYKALKPHFFNDEAGHPEVGCFTMDCKSTAGNLCKTLLKESSMFQTRLVCDEGCPTITEQNTVLKVSGAELKNVWPNFSQLEEMRRGVQRHCLTPFCSGKINSSITFEGELGLIEIIWEQTEQHNKVKLSDIPLHFKLSMMGTQFELRGILHTEVPEGLSKGVNVQNLEEVMNKMYTTYVLRNNSWMVIRSSEQSHFCDKTTKVSPVLILYSR